MLVQHGIPTRKNLCRLLVWLVALLSACTLPGRDEYNQGIEAWQNKNCDTAIGFFQKALEKNPNLGEAHQGIAECYLLQQKLKEAYTEYQEAQEQYDKGVFFDTPIPDEKKKQRVEEQLSWLKHAIELQDSRPTSNPSSAPSILQKQAPNKQLPP